MTVNAGLPPPDTYKAAQEATSRDLARMAHAHGLFWQIDPDKIEAHIKTAIRSVRGPRK